MKIKLLLTLLLSVACTALYAQEVQIEDNKVLLDGKQILKYEKTNAREQSFYSLSDDEILMFRISDNETPSYTNDDYFILNFLTERKKIESKSFVHVLSGMGMNPRKNMQKLISWLLKEKVLDSEGKINTQKLDIFYEKYHEDITARTLR